MKTETPATKPTEKTKRVEDFENPIDSFSMDEFKTHRAALQKLIKEVNPERESKIILEAAHRLSSAQGRERLLSAPLPVDKFPDFKGVTVVGAYVALSLLHECQKGLQNPNTPCNQNIDEMPHEFQRMRWIESVGKKLAVKEPIVKGMVRNLLRNATVVDRFSEALSKVREKALAGDDTALVIATLASRAAVERAVDPADVIAGIESKLTAAAMGDLELISHGNIHGLVSHRHAPTAWPTVAKIFKHPFFQYLVANG